MHMSVHGLLGSTGMMDVYPYPISMLPHSFIRDGDCDDGDAGAPS
jgi:hypothetical protein